MADPTLILTDSQGHDLQAISDVVLDLAYGDDENDFTLIVRDSFDMTRFTRGSRVYMDGTEYGGIVDTVSSSVTTSGSVVQYSGRTWQGLLAHKILSPDTGQDYLTVSGSVSSVLTSLFSRIKLDSILVAQPDTRLISYQFERYVDAWTGIRKMAKYSSLKPHMSYIKGQVHVSLLPVKTYEDVVDSDLLDFTATKNYRPVNHLIGLGTGELKNRAISHWYANAAGEISETQSLFGLDEVVEIYDYSNAEAKELKEETRKKLEELQSDGTIEVTLHDSDETLDLGDNVAARDNTTGLMVTSEVSKKIIKIEDGVLSVNYEVGEESTSQSLSGSSESSGVRAAQQTADNAQTTANLAIQNATECILNGGFTYGITEWNLKPNINVVSVSGRGNVLHAVLDKTNIIGCIEQNSVGQRLGYCSKARTIRVEWDYYINSRNLPDNSGFKVTAKITPDTTFQGGWLGEHGHSLNTPPLGEWLHFETTYYLPANNTLDQFWFLGDVLLSGDTVDMYLDNISVKDITDMTAISFLAAYPVGSIYHTSRSVNPGDVNGGTWKSLPSEIGYLWERLT